MSKNILLPEKKIDYSLPHFPTEMQAFIFRNWMMADVKKIAQVLGTSVENVKEEARRMELGPQPDVSMWNERGYISIIRANWHILNYDQLCMLLDISFEKLANILKEDDFFGVKLGRFKPFREPLMYRLLTAEEIRETEYIACSMREYVAPYPFEKEPFDFFSGDRARERKSGIQPDNTIAIDNLWTICDLTGDKDVSEMVSRFAKHMMKMWNVNLQFSTKSDKALILKFSEMEEEEHIIDVTEKCITLSAGTPSGIIRALYYIENECTLNNGTYITKNKVSRKPTFNIRFLYPYCGLFHSALDVDSRKFCPDELLERYASCGINGLWLHSVLYQISPFPFDLKISEGYEKRRENLKDFIARAKAYGIKIYLYLNEPRSMPVEFYDKFPDMKGTVSDDGRYACMCTSSERVREYINASISGLVSEIPDIGGFFTITMSENRTHCKSHPSNKIPCPRCSEKKAWELVADINTLIYESAVSVNPKIRIIAWDWGWTEMFGFGKGDEKECIKALSKDITVMCNREYGIKFVRGDVENKVIDYSISVSGVSETARNSWSIAQAHGNPTSVKTQINTTWECATVPYLPVFDKIKEHMENICANNVNNIMLGWSLGGYPSPNIKFISEYFFEKNGKREIDDSKIIKLMYNENAAKIMEASKIFSKAFSHFPFDVETVYNGPHNCGVSNLLYAEPTGLSATMTCFPYDDITGWRSLYPLDTFEKQFEYLCTQWKEGLDIIDGIDDEFGIIAYVSYTMFKSTLNQIRFIRHRDSYLKTNNIADVKAIIEILEEELLMASNVYCHMMKMPEIGFEAANQYYYTPMSVAEKIINCKYLIKYYTDSLNF